EFDPEAARAEFKAKAEPIISKVESNTAEIDKLKPPELKEIPPPPQRQDRSPVEAFGSAASTLAIFGSLLTRQPLTNALNAASGVMEAWKAQDASTAKQEFDIWKANVDNAKTLHDWQQGNYENIIKKFDTNTDNALKELQVYATMYRDDTMAELARTKQINE